MTILYWKCWVCPLDETDPNPIFGRIDEEDAEKEIYLLANYNLSKEFLGFIIITFSELKTYRIFKGKEEFQAYVTAHFTP